MTAPALDLAALTAADVMSTDLVTVDVAAPLGRALELLREHGVRHLPVVDRGRFVGLLDDRLVTLVLAGRPWNVHADERAGDVAATHVPQVHPSVPLPRVARLLVRCRTDAVVVVDADGALRGIVTTVDVSRAVAETGTD